MHPDPRQSDRKGLSSHRHPAARPQGLPVRLREARPWPNSAGLLMLVLLSSTMWSATNDYQIEWVQTGYSVNAGALAQPSVTLSSGNVLAMGGITTAGTVLNTCQMYDLSTGTWALTTPMNVARTEFGFLAMANGRVMVAGGFSTGNTWIAHAEIFSPTALTWTSIADLPFAGAPTLVQLQNGNVLAYLDGHTPEVYDISNNSWSPTGANVTARTSASSPPTATLVGLPAGGALLVGGMVGSGTFTTSCEVYTESTNQWSATASLAAGVAYASGYSISSGIIILYGQNSSGQVYTSEIYDPGTGTWSATGNAPHASVVAMTPLITGNILAIANNAVGVLAYEYSATNGTWSNITSSSTTRSNGCLAALPGGDAIIFQGSTSPSAGAPVLESEIFEDILINEPPSFTAGPAQTANENAGAQTITGWASGIMAGPPANTSLTVTFTVANSNNGLFSVQPAIDGTGTLTYTPAPDASGSATITVTAMNNGGTAFGGVDQSAAQTATITVQFVNQPPSFTLGANQSVLRTAGPQTTPNFMTGVTPGPGAGEAGFTTTTTVSNNDNALFSVQPSIDGTGTLTYTPGDSAGGTATVSVTVTNSGGTANGGSNATTQTFTITIIPVNHVPFFTIGTTVAVQENSGAVLIPGWCTNISAGNYNVGETVNFIVSNSNTTLFLVQPAIDPSGALSFTTATNVTGSATLTVQIHNNGGTANGGVDTSAAQTATIQVTTVPTVAITPTAMTTNASPIVFTFAFSESVNGFTASSFTVVNGTIGAFSGSGSTYTCAVTPKADGAVTVTVPADVCNSTANGNGNAPSSATVTSDRTSPTVTITPSRISTNASAVTFSFAFSKPVIGFTGSSVQLINGSPGVFLGSGASYTLVVDPIAVGQVSVSVPAGSCTDAVGNDVIASVATITFDDTPPTALIIPDGGSTNSSPILFVITFNKSVTSLAASAFTATNGTVGALTGSGTSYTLPVTPARQGSIGLTLAANACVDAFGNQNGTATATETYSTTAPTVIITPDGTQTNVDSIVFSFTFSESVLGFIASSVTVSNGVAGAFSGSGSSYYLQVTPSNQGAVQVTVPAGACTDAAGNPNIAASASVDYHTTAPTFTIAPSNIVTNAVPIVFTITPSETVVGLNASSFSCVNGAIGTLAQVGGGYTLTVTPTGNGTVTLSLPANACTDLAGNGNAPVSVSDISNTTPPTLTITPTGGSTNQDPIPFTFTFSETVTGFTARAITITNGTAGIMSGTGTSYVLDVTPTSQSTVTVSVAAGAGTDSAGNGSVAASASEAYNLTQPTVTITPNNTLTNQSPITFTFIFSQPVSGFTTANVALANGTAGTFAGSGATYSLQVIPTGQGAVMATVAAGQVQDGSGNLNTAGTATVTYDTTPPLLTISPTGITTNADPITFSFSFSEAVTGFTQSSVMLTNASGLTFNGSGAFYSLAVIPNGDGLVTASVAAGACSDLAGNPVAATSVSITSVRTPPGCMITPTGTSTNADPITFTLTFTKTVVGLTGSSLSISNGTLAGLSGTGSIYTAAVTPTADGAVVLSLPANVCTDIVGNGNTAASASVTSDRTPPSLAVSSPRAITNASPITFNFLFSTSVTGFDSSKITLTNGTLTSFTGAGATYAITVIPVTEGTVTAAVAAVAATDQDGNASLAGSFTVTYQVTPPALTITPSGTATNANAIQLTYTFTEPVSGFTSASITLTNATPGQLTGSGTAFTEIVAPISDGPITITVPNDACFDLAGNGCIGSTATITSIRTPPAATLSPNGTATNASPVTMAISFSSAVSGLTLSGFTATNATVSNLIGSGRTYSMAVAPASQGQVTVNLLAAACVDSVGNANLPATATFTYDTTPPTAVITPDGATTNASPLQFAITWDTAVTGFLASSIQCVDGTVSALTGSGSSYTLSVTPLADGVVSVTIPVGSATDAAGNPNAQAFSTSVTSIRTPPTVAIAPNGTSTNVTPTVVSIIFSEPVTGFTANGVTIANGTKGVLSGSGTTYSLPVFPNANGVVGITVVQGAGIDAAGNQSVANTASFTYNTTNPDCTITPNGIVTNANTVAMTVTFSEAVTGVAATAITVTNGTLGAITGSGTTYAVPVSPTADGVVTVAVAAGAGVDDAGNPSLPATVSFTSNRTPPTVAITPSGITTNASPIMFTFTFSEQVIGFGTNAIALTNGTASSFSGSGSIFTLHVIPSADGTVTVTVPGNAVQDPAGNGNIGNTATVTSLRSPPTPTITPDSGATNASPVIFTLTFPRAVTGFSASSLVVTNGTVGTITGAGPAYSVPVAPANQGLVTVTLPAGAVTDAVGNVNAVAQGSITYDTIPPVLAITPDSGIITTPSIVFSFAFTEVVTGFTASEITVSNGTPGAFTGSGANYSLTVTPTVDGTVSVAVGVGAAVDAAGNGSTSATATVTSIRSAPSVTITGPASPTNQDPLVITYTWSATVIDFSVAGIQISNGTGGALTGSGTVFTQAVTPTANGPVVITVLADAAQNIVGTGNAQTQATFVSNTTPPSVTITPNGITTNASPITFTLTFTEPVYNLSAANIAIANGTVGTLTGGGALYTLTVAPLVDGAVIVSVPAGICTDQAGNGNLLGQATVTSERSPPVPTITPNGTHAFTSPIIFTVLWSTAVMNFTGSELTVANGTVTAFSGTGSTYTVLVTPTTLGTVTLTVPTGVCTDTIGNLNATGAATVTYSPPTQPVVTLPSGSLIYQRGGPPINIASQATITDQNGLTSYDGGSLGVSIAQNAEASDVVALLPGTYGNWVVSASGQIVFVTPVAGGSTTTVGLVSGGSNNVDFAVSLDGSATPDVTVSLLQSIGFSSGNVINQKDTVVKTLVVSFNDGSGVAPGTAATTVTVLPVYPPPIANDATVNTLENQSYTGSLATLWTDQGVTNPTVTYALVGSPVGGTITAFDTVIGSYTFVPSIDSVANGSFSYTVTDPYNTSAPGTIAITIGPVDQPPSWTPGLDVTVAENAGTYTGVGWASGISPGPANQSDQTVSFALTAATPALFTVQPALSPTGTLTFTPATNQYGQSLVTAILSNSGGTSNGGQDSAPAVTFIISVTRVIQQPSIPTITMYSVPGVPVTAQIVILDPDHQLPAGTPVYQVTGVSQLGALQTNAAGLLTFSPTIAGSQQVAISASVGGTSCTGTVQLFDNALSTNRPLIDSTPASKAGASGGAWSYSLTVDPLSLTASSSLVVHAQSTEAALAAAVITQTSGNQFSVSVPELDAAGGPLQAVTLIVTDLSTDLSDLQTIILVVSPPGGPT